MREGATGQHIRRVPGTCRTPASRAPRVLLARTDSAEVRLVASLLRRDGFSVAEAARSIDLVHWLVPTLRRPKHPGFDAVVSEIDLPCLTAVEVLVAFRRLGCRIPVVLMAGAEAEAIRREAQEAVGARAVVRQPVVLEELRTALCFSIAEPAHWQRRCDA